MRFLHLKIENWRNFRRLDIPLQERVFIVGPNASGKSNLLDAIRFLQDLAEPSGGGLQEAVRKRNGVSAIRCLAARQYSDIVFDIRLGTDPQHPEWRYRLVFNQDNKKRPVLKEEVVHHADHEIIRRPDQHDETDKERLTQTYLEQVMANQEFRAIAEFLTSVRYMHVIPHLIRDPERFGSRAGTVARDPFGGDLLEQIARTQKKTLDSRLRKIREALHVAVPQLKELSLERDNVGTPHLKGKYEHWRPQGAWQNEDQFSDGTLRLMGLLWSVLDGSGPLLLEEPELSLHPGVVRFIPQMLWKATRKRKRQVFVTTHSADLLSDTGIAPDETVLLTPGREGTEASMAKDDAEIRDLLGGGLSMADAVLPKVAPRDPEQLALFGD